MRKHYPLTTPPGGSPAWTNLDPEMHHALVGSSTMSPPQWVGDLWLRLHAVAVDFGKNLLVRALKAVVTSAISIAAYLYFVGEQRGIFEMLSEAELRVAALEAGIIAGAVVFVLDMVLSVLKRAEGGAWYGTKFVYTAPQPVFTVYVTSDDNNKAFPIKLPMALPGAFVDLKVVVDRRDDRVKAQLNLAPSAPLGWDNLPAVDRKHGMKLSRLVPVYLTVRAVPEATATTVRVFILSIMYADKIDVKHT